MSALLDLLPGDGSGTFVATVPERLCVGSGERTFLFGGIALAACIEAFEHTSKAPAAFISGQFLTQARPDEGLSISIRSEGGSLRQGQVDASVGAKVFLRAIGVCGRRASSAEHQGSLCPDVPLPLECPERSVARLLSSNMQALFEFRLASGVLPDRAGWQAPGGQDLACWIRVRDGSPLDRRLLAVMADCAALAVPGALGRPASGSSLDNAIRFACQPEGQWVLAVTRVEAVLDGLVHTRSQLFAEDGQLLGLASQTMVLRLWE